MNEAPLWVYIPEGLVPIANAGPFPLDHGFEVKTSYRVLAIFDYSETSEAYFLLANSADEFWSISTRYCRRSAYGHRQLDTREVPDVSTR
jgi:hypothetical protein